MEINFLSIVMIGIKYDIFKENFPKIKLKEFKDAKQSITIKPFLYDGNFAGEIIFQVQTYIENKEVINLEVKYGFVLSEPFNNINKNVTQIITSSIYPRFKKMAEYIYSNGSFSDLEVPEFKK